jgi:hypothetical protein
MHTKFWLEIPKGRDHLEDLGKYERIISEDLQSNRVVRCGLHATG